MAAKKESSSKQLPTGPAGDKKAALETALAQIEKQFGKGAVMKLGTNVRSEERRVGKECRSRWSPYH